MTLLGIVIVDSATVERLAWTLLHTLWQGALIAAGLAVAMFVMRRRSAHARYATLCAGLLLTLVAPVITFCTLANAFDDPGPLVLPNASGPSAAPAHKWVDYARVAAAVRPWTSTILYAWVAGTIVLAIRQLIAWAWLNYLLKRHTRALGATLTRLEDVAARLRLPHVRFLESSFLDSPATMGWLKPVVLLPASALLGLAPEHLEAIVAHELAHIRRRDYVVNLLQTAAEVLMFYNPPIWWISRRVREERENCCDDIAATITGGGRAFADALLSLEEQRASMPPLAMAATGGTLWRRVARLVGAHDIGPSRRRRAGLLGVVASIAVVAALTSHVLATAVEIRPNRKLSDVQSVCGAVYDILEVRGETGVFVPALAEMMKPYRTNERNTITGEQLDAFADAVLRSRPDEFANVNLPNVHIGKRLAYENTRTWPYGNATFRIDLAERLYKRARDLHAFDPMRAAKLARAAMLLAANDTHMAIALHMQLLFKDPDYVQVAALTHRQESRLRRHLDDYLVITKAWVPLYASVKTKVRAEGALDAESVDQIGKQLAELVRMHGNTTFMQLRVAEIANEVYCRTDGKASLGLETMAEGKPHLARWLAEAKEFRPTTRPATRPTTMPRIVGKHTPFSR